MEPSYLFTQLGFAATTLLSYWLLLSGLRKSLQTTGFSPAKKRNIFRNTLLVLIGWAIVTTALSLGGFLNTFESFPPRFIVILLIPLVGIILSLRTEVVKEILAHTAPEFILKLQAFRIVVEILLLTLFLQHLAPIQMTFEGRNFDILTGLTGPIVAYLFLHKKISKTWVIIWNFAGLALLLNVVIVALLSLPTPLRVFMEEPSTRIVTQFPIIWLPAFLVPLAYGLHILSLRQLFSDKKEHSIV